MNKNFDYRHFPTYMKVILILSFPIIITMIITMTIVFGIIGFAIGTGLLLLLIVPAFLINIRRNKDIKY